MAETLKELKRMSDLGVHAVSFSDNPANIGLPSIHNEYWEPFWKACSDYKMVINCHIGTGARAMHPSPESPIDAWITAMPISIANYAADWTFATFWQRYPDLRMALRSEERRVGKACVSPGRSRGLPCHEKKKTNNKYRRMM